VEWYRIDALPDTGTLTAGGAPVVIGDTFTPAQIADGELEYETPADWNGSTSIQFSAFDGEAWSDPGTQTIVVVGEADAPTVTTSPASGTEDTEIALSVDVELADTDGSEAITRLEVSGAPAGTVFTDGTTMVTAWYGTADITALDLEQLRMTPGPDHDTDFTLTFSATSTEADSGDTAVGAATLDVHIDPVNDPPIPLNTTVTIDEDAIATVNIKAVEVDTGDTPETYRIESLPGHGRLALDGADVEVGDEISASDVLAGRLTFEPDADWSGQTSLQFSAFDGEVWSVSPGTLTIEVVGVADEADLSVDEVFVTEDGSAPIEIAATVTDEDGSESIDSIRIQGAPVGSVLSDGVNTEMAIGEPVDVTGWDLEHLEISPAANYDRNFEITVDVTTREADSGDTATTSRTVTVNVEAVNDAPIVQAGSVSVSEDTPATIVLEASEVDTGDAIEQFRIESLPEHGTLMLDGAAVSEGGIVEADAVDEGRLTFVPDADWSGETSLTFSAFDGEAWSETTGEFAISVSGVADAPVLTVADASGVEDEPIDLAISAALSDADGSESLSVVIGGVPEGATLSGGTDNGDGTWTLTPGELDGLSITAPADYSGSFDLTVTATSTESDGDSSASEATFRVEVAEVADEPPALPEPDADVSKPVVAGDPKPVAEETPELVVVDEPEPVVEEPEPVAEVPEPVAEDPEPVVEAEPEPAVEAPEPVAEETPERVVVDEPEVVEEPEPAAEAPEPVEEAREPVREEAPEPPVDEGPKPEMSDGPERAAEEPEAAGEEDPVPGAVASIDWRGDEELSVIGDPTSIDARLASIEAEAASLWSVDPVEAGPGPGYMVIGSVPPLEVETEGVEALPPPGEPLYELVEGARSEPEVDDRVARPAEEPMATESLEGVRRGAPEREVDRQFASVFGMLWALARSLGPRQSVDEEDD